MVRKLTGHRAGDTYTSYAGTTTHTFSELVVDTYCAWQCDDGLARSAPSGYQGIPEHDFPTMKNVAVNLQSSKYFILSLVAKLVGPSSYVNPPQNLIRTGDNILWCYTSSTRPPSMPIDPIGHLEDTLESVVYIGQPFGYRNVGPVNLGHPSFYLR